jgi:phosphopantothenoylcysteine decarboxylase / phosphopantothenate---cysteine ligase
MIIPTNLLKNKKILIGVSGSIAVYKSLELVRLFIKAGAEVKVVMSDAAKKFVTPLTFETLTSNPILDDTNESWVNEHNHIKSGEWADVFVIAPATANTMAKLANGIADNMLTQCALAYPKEKVLAPSANTNMLYNPITQENLEKLQSTQHTILQTQTKELACKTTGDGAMAEPIQIFWTTAKTLLKEEFWQDRNALITGGGTIEKIDDVRYISNFSSGKMASAVATALYCKGANISLIATRHENDLPQEIKLLKVQSSEEMEESLTNSLLETKKDAYKTAYVFMAAAVSDYLPKEIQNGKLKKENIGDNFTLEMDKNRDILSSIDKEGLRVIGFKAEMDEANAMYNATNMLKKKNIDAVCLNVLKDSSSFGGETNAIEFITKKGRNSIDSDLKLTVAFHIADNAKSLGE